MSHGEWWKTMDDRVYEWVLAHKPRAFLDALIQRGVKLDVNIDDLSDEDCRAVAREIIGAVQKREAH